MRMKVLLLFSIMKSRGFSYFRWITRTYYNILILKYICVIIVFVYIIIYCTLMYYLIHCYCYNLE
jgi:hypothetical protein